MDPYPRTWAAIDLGALKHNLAWVRSQVGSGVKICLAAKADAYGHGLAPVCRTAVQGEADWISVAAISEGIALRDAGVDEPILVLSPILPVEADQAVFYGLDVTVENIEVPRALAEASKRMKRRARIHLKVDTGLHRFGCRPDQVVQIAKAIISLDDVELVGVSQHFIDSMNDDERTKEQLAMFKGCLDQLGAAGIRPAVIHAANSYGTLKHADSRFDMVRIGILAYGVDPIGSAGGALKPVMSLRSRVMAERQVPAGETVGYCSIWKAERETRVLTIGAGYGDGIPKTMTGNSQIEINGCLCPVIGSVCMDLMTVDATDCPAAQVGHEAILIGGSSPADVIAGEIGTNSHEVITRIMSRVTRRWIYS